MEKRFVCEQIIQPAHPIAFFLMKYLHHIDYGLYSSLRENIFQRLFLI